MSDFILEYEVLEEISKNSKSLGKRAEDYGESLQSKIISGIEDITGASSGYLVNASDLVRDKINTLNQKSQAFYSFAEQIANLLIIAEETDQEVADAIAAQREYFLEHHKSLRIEDWKAKLLDLLVEMKNSIPLLNLLADILKGLEAVFESLGEAVKHWYECRGGKYIINVVWSIGEVAFAIAGVVAALAVPGAGFFAVCGIIGASIALMNGVTNMVTSFRAANAGVDENPAWAVIYGKQDKLSDVLRQTNFGDGTRNTLSNLSAGTLDVTETFCDIVGIAEMAGLAKLFKGDAFKKLKNGTLSFSDLKNSAKNGIVDLKNTIKNGYKDLKNGSKLDDIGGVHKPAVDINASKSVEMIAEGSGQPVQAIKNRYPGDPQAGKEFGCTIKDGKILVDNSIQDVDFVVDMNDNLHIGRGHSFLAGGKEVQAAGTIKVNSQGYVRNITNASGHFSPTVEQGKLFPNVLDNLGIRTENAWLELGDYHFTPSGYVDVTKSKIIVEQIK